MKFICQKSFGLFLLFWKTSLLPPPPSSPSPLPLFPSLLPLSFLGGRGGGRGEGGGEPPPPPPGGGGTKSPPPPDFNGFFTQGRLIWNIFLFSLSLSSLCVIYPRGRSAHSSKLQRYCPLKAFLVAYFNEIWNGLIFLSFNLSSLCVIYHWRIIYFE